ncbi:glycosyltransferase [Streptomyces guryensis]|uniref:D-inositol 3-phosphate glycosyltransferase n=1 Tax=Streptomyces guryensis TaxID=2886947 RepID=A0A9Q3VHI0_9ACTN|nr:glycosyltransferase [Streptomyces guryensis]MCD9872244.1 glycosyltransferase [Streptomyces guryensis]
MRALHVITGLGVGGAEQQLRLLLRHLPAQCDVVTLTNPGAVAAGLAADGVRVTHLGIRGNHDLGALPRLTRLIRSGGYDLVHTHLYRACLYGRIAARLAGVRAVVATEHSIGDTRLEGRPLTPGVRALYLAGERLGRTTVAVSPTVGERLRHWGVPGARIRVIPNGIDAPRFRFDEVGRKKARAFYGLPQDVYVVGGVGRLAAGKRFELLVRALPQLPGDVRLLLVGGGPEEEMLRRIARELGVADRMVLTGERPYLPDPGDDAPDLVALLSAMDVLASPSAEESFGLAVVEALAAGLPVLYANCPAVEDLPPEAAPGARRVVGGAAAYARELLRLQAAGPGDRTVPAAVHRYDIAHSARQLMDVYTAALAGSNLEVSSP